MTTITPEPNALDPDQRARAKALHEARSVLIARPNPLAQGAPHVVDLVTVATWVIDGRDPWPEKS